jgi:hypothetical protein
MFSGKPKSNVDNIGIMSGFMMPDEEEPSEDFEGHGEDFDAMQLADRRPNSPEVLMNNLRGDMRSVDARYEELSKLVGPAVARDTPEEVLALLQPVLAEQQSQGIGALPGAQGMPGMPPPAQAPGMPPAQAPGMPPAPGGIGALLQPPQAAAPAPQQQGPMPPFPSAPDAGAAPAQGPAPIGMAAGGEARAVATAGRYGDTSLAHLSPAAQYMLRDFGGTGAINPRTGLQEYAPWWMSAARAIPKLGDDLVSPAERVANSSVPRSNMFSLPSSAAGMFSLPSSAAGMLKSAAKWGTGLGVAGAGVNYISDKRDQAAPSGPSSQESSGVITTPGTGETVVTTDQEQSSTNPPVVPPAVVLVPGGSSTNSTVLPPAVGEQVSAPTPTPTSATDNSDFIKKVQQRERELNQVMRQPGDLEDRQAQALFLIADAALAYNRPGAGRNTFERLSYAGKNIPSGLAALASQESSMKTKIRGAAVQQVLDREALESKEAASLNLKRLDLLKTLSQQNLSVDQLMESIGNAYPNFSLDQRRGFAVGLNNKTMEFGTDPASGLPIIKNNLTGQVTQLQAPQVMEYAGQINPRDPNARVMPAMYAVTEPGQAKKLSENRTDLQGFLGRLEGVLGGDFFNSFGIKSTAVQVFGNKIFLPVAGPSSSLTNIQKADKIAQIEALNQEYRRMVASHSGRPGQAEMAEIGGLFQDPEKFLSSPEVAFSQLNRVRVDTINKIADTTHMLSNGQVPRINLDVNGRYGIGPDSAFDLKSDDSVRLLLEMKAKMPTFEPYILGARGQPERVTKDNTAFWTSLMKTPRVQEILNRRSQ